jgi:hypothetical protein
MWIDKKDIKRILKVKKIIGYPVINYDPDTKTMNIAKTLNNKTIWLSIDSKEFYEYLYSSINRFCLMLDYEQELTYFSAVKDSNGV